MSSSEIVAPFQSLQIRVSLRRMWLITVRSPGTHVLGLVWIEGVLSHSSVTVRCSYTVKIVYWISHTLCNTSPSLSATIEILWFYTYWSIQRRWGSESCSRQSYACCIREVIVRARAALLLMEMPSSGDSLVLSMVTSSLVPLALYISVFADWICVFHLELVYKNLKSLVICQYSCITFI